MYGINLAHMLWWPWISQSLLTFSQLFDDIVRFLHAHAVDTSTCDRGDALFQLLP